MTRIIISTVLPERQLYYEYLKRKLPQAEFSFDQGKNAMNTFLNALEMAGDDPAIFMEDDAILTKDFVNKIEYQIMMRPKHVINFFSRRKADETEGSRYIAGGNYSSNVCFYVPEGFAAALLRYSKLWIRENIEEHPTGMDFLVKDFLAKNRMKYFNHVPSLVQHRVGKSSISTRRARERISKTFIDPDY